MAAPAATPEPHLRAWLVRGANVRGRNLVPRWLDGGWCSIGWGEAGPLAAGSDRAELRAGLAAAYPRRSPAWRRTALGNLDRFLNRIRIGDLVVTVNGAEVYVGVVRSPPWWEPSAGPGDRHRRRVRWANPGDPVLRSALSPDTAAKLRTMLTVADCSAVAGEFASLHGGFAGHQAADSA